VCHAERVHGVLRHLDFDDARAFADLGDNDVVV